MPPRITPSVNPQETVRPDIESEHNKLRDEREKRHVLEKTNLEQIYQEDLEQLKRNKETALVSVGLNPDGSTPDDWSHDILPVAPVEE